jgi:Sulfatase
MIFFQKAKKKWPGSIHCFLIPVFFIIHTYFDFKGLFNPSKLTVSYLSWLLLPFLLYVLLKKLLKDAGHAALYTSFLLIIYFFTGPAIMHFKQSFLFSFFFKYSVLLPLLCISCTVVFIYLKKTNRNHKTLHNYFSVTLIALILFEFTVPLIKGADYYTRRNSLSKTDTPLLVQKNTGTIKPDIYFLLMDEHPSTKSIMSMAGYDNSSLDTALTRKGFKVSAFATSAYPKTDFSIFVLFDMSRIAGIDESTISFKQLFMAKQELPKARLFPFLKKQGYHIINGSIHNLTAESGVKNYDEWIGEPQDLIRGQTFFNRANEDIGWQLKTKFPRLFKSTLLQTVKTDISLHERALAVLDSSLQLPVQQPKLVYAHFYLPHEPFRYDSTGNPHNWTFATYSEALKTKTPYVEQIAYTRAFILELVSKIQQENKRPAVIIVQGDHGLRRYDAINPSEADWYKILSAVYFPDGDYSNVNDSLFSPNTFRIILNKYFGQQLTLLNNRHKESKK